MAGLRRLAVSRDRGEADRARAVLLTLSGWTSPRIAEAFGVREDTVRLWRSDFSRAGVEALETSPTSGPAPVKAEAALRVAAAQTLRKVFRLLDTQALQRGFAAWAASVGAEAQGVIAVDGKTLRGSKTSPDGKGALHLVSAYATQAGLVLANARSTGSPTRSRRSRSSSTCSPSRARSCRSTPWALRKRSPGASSTRARTTCSRSKATRPACTRTRRCFSPIRGGKLRARAGHRRRPRPDRGAQLPCRNADWLADRHPDWKDLRSIAAVTARRIDKKTGCESLETRYWGGAHLEFLRRFLPFDWGVPSGRWLNIMMNRIDPGLFAACFMDWVRA